MYELKFIAENLYDFRVIDRLERSLTIFWVMHLFYIEQNQTWIQKAIFYTIELTARVLASNLQQRIWNFIGKDCTGKQKAYTKLNDSEHKKICENIKPIFSKFLDLGPLCMEKKSDEFHCVEKIKQCLTIYDYIEDDFEAIGI